MHHLPSRTRQAHLGQRAELYRANGYHLNGFFDTVHGIGTTPASPQAVKYLANKEFRHVPAEAPLAPSGCPAAVVIALRIWILAQSVENTAVGANDGPQARPGDDQEFGRLVREW